MITVFGEGRGFRVVWLLEEMGLSCELRPVDLLAGIEKDAEYLAINPAGFIPAIRDGDLTMVESIAIMEYLMARYGPTPLSPEPRDPTFAAYQQFLHLGEAGLAASPTHACTHGETHGHRARRPIVRMLREVAPNQKLERSRQPVSRRLRDKPRAPACVPVGFVVRPQS